MGTPFRRGVAEKPAARETIPDGTRQMKAKIREEIRMREEENVVDARKSDIHEPDIHKGYP
jgi:hypothetical protein